MEERRADAVEVMLDIGEVTRTLLALRREEVPADEDTVPLFAMLEDGRLRCHEQRYLALMFGFVLVAHDHAEMDLLFDAMRSLPTVMRLVETFLAKRGMDL